jgi:hypothetical protein
MRIYNAKTALQAEDAVFAASNVAGENAPVPTESSVAHFCAFVDFYTRKSTDPINTALVCEEQAEELRLDPQELTPETVQMLIDTLLNAIDHLGKKWLDEQIQHDHRKQQHRQDVARLYQQLSGLQARYAEEYARQTPLYRKGFAWLRQHFARNAPQRQIRRKPRTHKLPQKVQV